MHKWRKHLETEIPWGSKSWSDWGPKILILWKTVRNKEYPKSGFTWGFSKGMRKPELRLLQKRGLYPVTTLHSHGKHMVHPRKKNGYQRLWSEMTFETFQSRVEEQEPKPTQFPRACAPNSPTAFPIQSEAIRSGGSLTVLTLAGSRQTKAFTTQGCFSERIPNYSTGTCLRLHGEWSQRPQTWSEVTAESLKLQRSMHHIWNNQINRSDQNVCGKILRLPGFWIQ